MILQFASMLAISFAIGAANAKPLKVQSVTVVAVFYPQFGIHRSDMSPQLDRLYNEMVAQISSIPGYRARAARRECDSAELGAETVHATLYVESELLLDQRLRLTLYRVGRKQPLRVVSVQLNHGHLRKSAVATLMNRDMWLADRTPSITC